MSRYYDKYCNSVQDLKSWVETSPDRNKDILKDYYEVNTVQGTENIVTELNSEGNFSKEIVVPVVFHLIHMGEQVGQGMNLNYSFVVEALNILNNKFSGFIANPISDSNSPRNLNIRFTTAKSDPDDNILNEPGLHRIDGSNMKGSIESFYSESSYLENNPSYDYSLDGVAHSTLGSNGFIFPVDNVPGVSEQFIKAEFGWDINKYFNIYLVNSLNGNPLDFKQSLLGSSTFPFIVESSNLDFMYGVVMPIKALGIPATQGLLFNYATASTNGLPVLNNIINDSTIPSNYSTYLDDLDGNALVHNILHCFGLIDLHFPQSSESSSIDCARGTAGDVYTSFDSGGSLFTENVSHIARYENNDNLDNICKGEEVEYEVKENVEFIREVEGTETQFETIQYSNNILQASFKIDSEDDNPQTITTYRFFNDLDKTSTPLKSGDIINVTIESREDLENIFNNSLSFIRTEKITIDNEDYLEPPTGPSMPIPGRYYKHLGGIFVGVVTQDNLIAPNVDYNTTDAITGNTQMFQGFNGFNSEEYEGGHPEWVVNQSPFSPETTFTSSPRNNEEDYLLILSLVQTPKPHARNIAYEMSPPLDFVNENIVTSTEDPLDLKFNNYHHTVNYSLVWANLSDYLFNILLLDNEGTTLDSLAGTAINNSDYLDIAKFKLFGNRNVDWDIPYLKEVHKIKSVLDEKNSLSQINQIDSTIDNGIELTWYDHGTSVGPSGYINAPDFSSAYNFELPINTISFTPFPSQQIANQSPFFTSQYGGYYSEADPYVDDYTDNLRINKFYPVICKNVWDGSQTVTGRNSYYNTELHANSYFTFPAKHLLYHYSMPYKYSSRNTTREIPNSYINGNPDLGFFNNIGIDNQWWVDSMVTDSLGGWTSSLLVRRVSLQSYIEEHEIEQRSIRQENSKKELSKIEFYHHDFEDQSEILNSYNNGSLTKLQFSFKVDEVDTHSITISNINLTSNVSTVEFAPLGDLTKHPMHHGFGHLNITMLGNLEVFFVRKSFESSYILSNLMGSTSGTFEGCDNGGLFTESDEIIPAERYNTEAATNLYNINSETESRSFINNYKNKIRKFKTTLTALKQYI